MFWLKFSVLLVGTSAVHGLHLSTSRMTTRRAKKFESSFLSAQRSPNALGATNLAIVSSNSTDLSSVRDMVYMTSVTVAGKEYAMQIDTGSSDMWIRSDSMADTQVSDLAGNITYGIGWAAGPISRADVSFAGYNVTSQAFVMAAEARNTILNLGADGLIGLGPNTQSTIDQLVNKAGNSWGRNILYNIFAQSPNTPNFIAFLLQRSNDATSLPAEGSFTVGELEPEYEAEINASDAIPTWPPGYSNRWTIVVDGYDTTGGVLRTFSSSVRGMTRGKAVALLDSGTSFAYASEEFCKTLYSDIPGATFSSALGQWSIPCDQEVNLGLSIGGRRFPMHPLDMASPSPENTTCYGNFIPRSFGKGEYDLLLGDAFLRNVYAMFDLGDWVDGQPGVMGTPYVKLLSTTNATGASMEFHQLRGGFTTEANKISNAQSSTSSFSGWTVSVGEDKLDRLVRFAEIMLSLLAISTVLLIVGVGAILYFVFFRRKRGTPSGTTADSAFGLGHLRLPGPAYQQVPSVRNSAAP